jgi:hypothetical protein
MTFQPSASNRIATAWPIWPDPPMMRAVLAILPPWRENEDSGLASALG